MTENNNHVNPRVFISYSWDSPEHKLWVESLAGELRNCGIDARLDSWRDESQSIDDFMMIELERADYVVVICTPQFKRKIVENAEGGAGTASGFEMGTAAALRRSRGKDIIPVLTLAVPALLISTALVGVGLWWLLPVDLIVALLFGALISATDPVAVIALFKELGTPERLTVMVACQS